MSDAGRAIKEHNEEACDLNCCGKRNWKFNPDYGESYQWKENIWMKKEVSSDWDHHLWKLNLKQIKLNVCVCVYLKILVISIKDTLFFSCTAELFLFFSLFFQVRKPFFILFLKLCQIFLAGVDGDLPYSHQVAHTAGKEGLASSRPGQRGALGRLCLAAGTENFLFQFICNQLVLQVPDLDAGASSSTEPVVIRAEAQGAADVSTIKCVKVLAFVEVPQ